MKLIVLLLTNLIAGIFLDVETLTCNIKIAANKKTKRLNARVDLKIFKTVHVLYRDDHFTFKNLHFSIHYNLFRFGFLNRESQLTNTE